MAQGNMTPANWTKYQAEMTMHFKLLREAATSTTPERAAALKLQANVHLHAATAVKEATFDARSMKRDGHAARTAARAATKNKKPTGTKSAASSKVSSHVVGHQPNENASSCQSLTHFVF
jgi:hypothetical protein